MIRRHAMNWGSCILYLASLMACRSSSPPSLVAEEPVVQVTMPDGSVWTGLTPAPAASQRRLREHPRILVTADSLPGLKEKLDSPIYQADLARLFKSDDPTDKAFVYLVFGDRDAGLIAKQALLTNKIPRWKRFGGTIDVLQAALLFDWLHDLLSPEERKRAQAIVTELATKRRDEKITYYWNDMWSRGPAFQTVAALALDNEWAAKTRAAAYDAPQKVFGPYAGGAIDVLNSMALSSGGGDQAGIQDSPGVGYEGFFQTGASMFVPAWTSATGEDLVHQTNYFAKLANYVTQCFLNVKPVEEGCLQTLEFATGMSSGNDAALAAWMLERYGRARYALVPRLILGDRRVPPKSPEQLGMPLCDFVEGADTFCSRSGWQDDDVVVLMLARHWDTNRYEPSSACLALYKSGRPLLVLGTTDKKFGDPTRTSGVWIWQKDDPSIFGSGSTYWGSLVNVSPKSFRAQSAAPVSLPANQHFRPLTMAAWDPTTHSATTSYAKTLMCRGIDSAVRHLSVQHAPSSTTLKVEDQLELRESVQVAVSLRLVDEPTIVGNQISVPGMKIVVDSAFEEIIWQGGVGNEFGVPWSVGDKVYESKRKRNGYAKQEKELLKHGLGNLFIMPRRGSDGRVDVSMRITVDRN